MGTKHTPGPWVWECDPEEDCGTNMFGADGVQVIEYAHWSSGMAFANDNRSINVANARLIAAAPELLGALEDYVKTHEFLGHADRPHYRAAIKAIAKAKGETEA